MSNVAMVDFGKLPEQELKNILHCIERYEVFMGAATVRASDEAFQRDVEKRVRLYRTRLSTDRLFPWPLCGQLPHRCAQAGAST